MKTNQFIINVETPSANADDAFCKPENAIPALNWGHESERPEFAAESVPPFFAPTTLPTQRLEFDPPKNS